MKMSRATQMRNALVTVITGPTHVLLLFSHWPSHCKAQSNHQQQKQGQQREGLETEAVCLGKFSLHEGWSTQVQGDCVFGVSSRAFNNAIVMYVDASYMDLYSWPPQASISYCFFDSCLVGIVTWYIQNRHWFPPYLSSLIFLISGNIPYPSVGEATKYESSPILSFPILNPLASIYL